MAEIQKRYLIGAARLACFLDPTAAPNSDPATILLHLFLVVFGGCTRFIAIGGIACYTGMTAPMLTDDMRFGEDELLQFAKRSAWIVHLLAKAASESQRALPLGEEV